jgi:threonine/homoserine/homoserine lactone efflux protein
VASDISRLAEFASMALIVELTPGPNMAYLATISIAHGRRAGFAAVLGVATGLLAYGLLAALGFSAIIEAIPGAYETLRWCGVLYMVWLAVETWRGEEPATAVKPRAPPGDKTLLWRGFAINMLNPKLAIFYLAVLPLFADPSADHLVASTLALVGVYVLVATVVHATIVVASAALSPWLNQSGGREKSLRRAIAVALVAIAGWMLYSTRR